VTNVGDSLGQHVRLSYRRSRPTKWKAAPSRGARHKEHRVAQRRGRTLQASKIKESARRSRRVQLCLRESYHQVQMSAQNGAASEGIDAEPAPTILIVDDEPDLVSALAELLEYEGHAVATATDGDDALNQLRQGLRPGVIILDLMIPRMNGWYFRREQLKDDDLKEIPVVVLTASHFSDASTKGQFADIEFAPKPMGYAALLSVLGQYAEGGRCGRARRDGPELH
jgi:CheY-like chemotaxis protein